MEDDAFVGLLEMFMCADPWTYNSDRWPVENLLDDEARNRGFCDWIEAYHKFPYLPLPPAAGREPGNG